MNVVPFRCHDFVSTHDCQYGAGLFPLAMNIRFHFRNTRGFRQTGIRGAALVLIAIMLAGGTVLYSGCGVLEVAVTPLNKLSEIQERAARRKQPPVPESVWNHTGMLSPGRWHRIGTSPARYIPRVIGSITPHGPGDGTWFVDERDGKRLFVPNTIVDGVSPKDFRRMAVEITNDSKGEVDETVR